MSTTPRRALVVIDVQNEYVTGNLPIEHPPIEQTLPNIGRAMDAARAAGIPVVVVQHSAPAASPLFAKGSPGWELHATVASRPRDHLIEKMWPSVYTGTDFADWLERHEIDTLVIAGYMTHNCDVSTVIHAVHLGLEVEFLADASGALPYANRAGSASAEEIHRAFTVVLQSNFAAVLNTSEWIAALAGGAAPARDNILVSNRRARAQAAAVA